MDACGQAVAEVQHEVLDLCGLLQLEVGAEALDHARSAIGMVERVVGAEEQDLTHDDTVEGDAAEVQVVVHLHQIGLAGLYLVSIREENKIRKNR